MQMSGHKARWAMVAAALAAGAGVAVDPAPAGKAPATAVRVPPAKLMAQADAVIVGRVIGLIDTKPVARTRKRVEAHYIQVERTLKGVRIDGQRLRIRPNGLLWEDGKSYILCLKKPALGDWVEALAGPLIGADRESIAATIKAVAAAGGRITPMPVLWMRHTGGWGGGLLKDFQVGPDRAFHYRARGGDRKNPRWTRLRGVLPKDALQRLVRRIGRAGAGPVALDAGTVSFQWTDAGGKLQSRTYSLPSRPPCSELIKTVDALAAKHGKRSLTDQQMADLAGETAKKADAQAELAPLQSANPHLGKRIIANPLANHRFWCVRLPRANMEDAGGPPHRRFLCVSRSGTVTFPFKADDFAAVLADEDPSSWGGAQLVQAAALYVHLTSPANEDGWKLLQGAADFMAITFNMPRAGPHAAKRQQAAKGIVKPVATPAKAGGKGKLEAKLFAWHLIGGRLREWTITFAPKFHATARDLGQFGGGGYD